MSRTNPNEISEHDQLVLMMAQHFQSLGYTDIRADIPNWRQPLYIYWQSNPNQWYYPDLTCVDTNGNMIILEAETCSTLGIQHTKEQFEIFRAHANKMNGRFEVVVPVNCSEKSARARINQVASTWGIKLDNVWTPGS